MCVTRSLMSVTYNYYSSKLGFYHNKNRFYMCTIIFSCFDTTFIKKGYCSEKVHLF